MGSVDLVRAMDGERSTSREPEATPPAPVPRPRKAPEGPASEQAGPEEVLANQAQPGPAQPQQALPEQRVPEVTAPPDGVVVPSRTHRWGIGAYLVVEAVFLGVSLLMGFAILSERVSVAGLAVALTVPTVSAAATAVLITRMRGNGPRIDLGLVWSWQDARVGLAYGFGGLALTVPASLLWAVLVGQDANSTLGDIFGGLRAGPVAAIGVAFVVVVLAPICEEIVYRGLLWGAVERYTVRRWVPFAVTTLLFALAHFEFTRTPLLFVVALPIALARLMTGRLVASIVAHQVNNLVPGVVLALTLVGVTPTL